MLEVRKPQGSALLAPFAEKREIGRMSKEKVPTTLASSASPVSAALIAICEKCGRKISGEDGEANVSRRLQKSLKAEIAAQERKDELRAIVSSCLHLCPNDAVAVAILPVAGQGQARFFEADVSDPGRARDEILRAALTSREAP